MRLNALGEKRVAGEDRDGLSELHVCARLAPSQVVVVERRQIVVNQAEGVNQLESARGRQQLFRRASERRRRSPGRAPGGSACLRRGGR